MWLASAVLASMLFVGARGDVPLRPQPLTLSPSAFELPGNGLALAAVAPEEGPTRSTLLRAQRTLKVATGIALLGTSAAGVLTALNQGTVFWNGRCGDAGRTPLLGQYGCENLSLWHGIGGVATTLLYTATGVVSLTIPDYPDDSPTGRPDAGGALYRALNWSHLVLLGLQPVLGFVAAYPGLIGIENGRTRFSRVLRTVHAGTGVLALATFGTTLAMEF